MLLVLIIAPFWISYLMRMLSWVNLLQPNGYVNRILMALGVLQEPRGWLDGDPLTVVLGLVYGYVPFLILPLFASLDRIDRSLLEAARDLGASPARAFARVTLPLSKQGILAGSVIILLPMFGDYYTPDLLSGATRTTMFGNQIYFFLNSGTGGSKGAAMVVILERDRQRADVLLPLHGGARGQGGQVSSLAEPTAEGRTVLGPATRQGVVLQPLGTPALSARGDVALRAVVDRARDHRHPVLVQCGAFAQHVAGVLVALVPGRPGPLGAPQPDCSARPWARASSWRCSRC